MMGSVPQVIEIASPTQRAFRPLRCVLIALGLAAPVLLIIMLVAIIAQAVRATTGLSPTVMGIGGGVLGGLLLLLFTKVWKGTGKGKVAQLIAGSQDLPAEERAQLILSDGHVRRLHPVDVLSSLISAGMTNTVLLQGKARELNRTPLEAPFEPVPVNESAPAFADLRSLADDRDAAPASGRAALLPPRWRRRLALGAGWFGLFFLVFNFVPSVVVAWRSWRLTPEVMLWSVLLILCFVGIGGVGAWRSTEQWLLVPGGLVRRLARGRSSTWMLQLFTPSSSILLLKDTEANNRVVAVADAHQSASVEVTVAEAELLLRVWLSPMPPPSIERLSDLR